MSTMIFELAVVEDRGSHWLVTNVTKNSLDNLANREEQLLKLSYVTYKLISDAIVNGSQVRISKSLATDEVLPHEIQIVTADEQGDPLQLAKDATVTRIRMLVTPSISKIAGLTLYSFTILNNDLASRGFFITDTNREEMYLKILETGDESLVQKLEEYLNFRDEIERVASLERKFAAFRLIIRDIQTAEDLATAEQQFLTEFYSHF